MDFSTDINKSEVFLKIKTYCKELHFTIIDEDKSRPWGGYLVIDEGNYKEFIRRHFPDHSIEEFSGYAKLSPKILLVEPEKRLSWQYHYRRSELWRVIHGTAGVIISQNDEQGELQKLNEGEEIELEQGIRHRLVGLDEWAVVAEIWKHTDKDHPSDEDDIVRVQDDFGR